MATLIIPTRTDGTPYYSFTVALDEAVFELTLQYVERSAAWFLSIAEQDGTPLLSGRRLVLGAFVTRRYKDPRLPAGDFHLVDTSGQSLAPGLYDLGARVLLLYTEGADWPAGVLR